jgi:hypothetical protein
LTKNVFKQLHEAAPGFEKASIERIRFVVKRFIELKGEEEYEEEYILTLKDPDKHIRDSRLYYLRGNCTAKINYTISLFELVKDHDVKTFFNDLHLGLDYVLSKWDKSGVNPEHQFYYCNPTAVLATPLKLKRKPVLDSLEGWPPKMLYELLLELEEFTGLHGTFVPQ